jgi:hypothetical protein
MATPCHTPMPFSSLEAVGDEAWYREIWDEADGIKTQDVANWHAFRCYGFNVMLAFPKGRGEDFMKCAYRGTSGNSYPFYEIRITPYFRK